MTHICRFLLTETRGRPQYYACHVCGALRPVHVPDVSTKPEQAQKVDREPCYFHESGKHMRESMEKDTDA